MQNLFTWKYWLTINPEPLTRLAFNVLIGVTILFVVLSIISTILKKKRGIYRGFIKKIYNFSFTNFIIGVIILFFNYENVPFFSSRLIIGLWILGIIFWIILILKTLKEIPKRKKDLLAQKELKKYLP